MQKRIHLIAKGFNLSELNLFVMILLYVMSLTTYLFVSFRWIIWFLMECNENKLQCPFFFSVLSLVLPNAILDGFYFQCFYFR